MVFWSHLIYTLVFIVTFFTLGFLSTQEKEVYDRLSSGRKKLIAAVPYILMALIWVFPFMDAAVRADSFLSFYNRFTLELVTASFFNLHIFFICTKTGKELEGVEWLPSVLFLGYTLVKNFAFNGFWMGLLAEALAIATLIGFVFFTLVLNVITTPRTKEELEQEAKEREMQEQQRMQEYERARANSPYRYTISTVPTGNYSSSDSSSSSYSSSSDENDFRKCCRNCRYYAGGICNCKYTSSYERTIFDPYSESCGYFHDSYR